MNLNKNNSFLNIYAIISKLLLFTFILIGINACQSSKYLKEGEYLLGKNKLLIKGEMLPKQKSILKAEIESLYSQKENTKVLFIFPREYTYYANSYPEDTLWYNRFLRNSIGERPTIYDTQKTKKTSQTIEKFLVNKKGFFNATVSYSTDTDSTDKRVNVEYDIDLNEQYTIKTLNYFCNDKNVLDLIKSNLDESDLQVGGPIDESHFAYEKSRIANLLQNNGYADFNSRYIQVKGDSTDNIFSVDMLLDINTPSEDKMHSIYTIGNISIHMDYNQTEKQSLDEPTIIDNIKFYKKGDKFIIKPKYIKDFIYFRSGDIYDNSKKQKTYRKLSQLEPYQFANIVRHMDKENKTVDYDIYLTPHTYRKKWGIAADLYFANSTYNKWGLSITPQLIDRNLFRGGEKLLLNLDAGIELQFNEVDNETKVRFNHDINIQSKIEYPKLHDIIGEFSLLNKLHLLSDEKYKTIKEETNSEFKGGYNFVNLVDLYQLSKFNLSFGYNYQPTINKRMYYEPIAFTIYDPNPYPPYQKLLDTIPLLNESFTNSFTSGLLFSNLSYSVVKTTLNGRRFYWFAKLELSGVENLLFNQVAKIIDSDAKPWSSLGGLDFSRFAKFNLEFRLSKTVSKNSVIASRLNFGIASPFSNKDVIPYFKQFYIGGPNSLRAWSERELGPGGNAESLRNPPKGIQSFFQTGDILMEANIEYRISLFENNKVRWEFASFIDAGNIWTLKEDLERKDTQFSSDFYKQIAVGAGAGIRIDFDYFLLRFDFAYKLRKPYPDEETGSYWDTDNTTLGNFNFAINHPF